MNSPKQELRSVRSQPWGPFIVAGMLSAIGVVGVTIAAHGFSTGWLLPSWNSLKEPQATVIAQALTVYAAAFATVVAPLLFRGQFRGIEEASNEAAAKIEARLDAVAQEMQSRLQGVAEENDAANRAIRETQEEVLLKLVTELEQARSSLSVLQNYALHSMGFVNSFTDADLMQGQHIVSGFQESSAILCKHILHNSNKWASTKQQFDRKWPGRREYISMLRECNLISDAQKKNFDLIADSQRYTRERNPDKLDLATLNILNKAMRELQEGVQAPG